MSITYVIGQARDASYSSCIPDLTGCTTCADAIELLLPSLIDAITKYLKDLVEHNVPVPCPGSVTGIVEVT